MREREESERAREKTTQIVSSREVMAGWVGDCYRTYIDVYKWTPVQYRII